MKKAHTMMGIPPASKSRKGKIRSLKGRKRKSIECVIKYETKCWREADSAKIRKYKTYHNSLRKRRDKNF